MLSVCLMVSCGQKSELSRGPWLLSFDKESKTVRIDRDSVCVAKGVYTAYKWQDTLVTNKDYDDFKIRDYAVNDDFGNGSIFEITYTDDVLPTLVQSFYVYDDREYLLTDFALGGSDGMVSSNYMAPLNCEGIVKQEEVSDDNRALFVPFDNDCWVRYKSHPLHFDTLVSYEVTAIFNNKDRHGRVIGSVEHDNWKTAVEMRRGDNYLPGALSCYGGVADKITRDSKAHGALTGKMIKSPKVFVGYFDDWRNGLEEYGKANAIVTPAKEWSKPVPFGWNSWGVLQFGLTYPKALEVSDYFKENLQNNNFENGNAVCIGLDSGWNSFSEDELKNFVTRCKANGQIAGVYWTPFTDWGRNPERNLDYAPDYQYKDAYVYANGKPQELDGAYALDPTHPAVEQQMKTVSDLFRRCGFEYVKMDFMTHGSMEGDRWHDAAIKTGMQAYNRGMSLLNKYFGDMYLNLSISPIFPAQYAQSRRIACDAWNKIKDTEYTLNALSYGWWINHVYAFNDADHIVLKDATEGENRARVTSAVITGLYIAGDDYSKEGSAEGKERSARYLTNAAVNQIATGRSFRPVEGNSENSENQFILMEENGGVYYAVFNYTDRDMSLNIPVKRIGLDAANGYTATDLWENEPVDVAQQLVVPAKDVRLIRINN